VSIPGHAHELERHARTIGPGGWAVESARPIATLLGSCVAVCLWDPVLRIGGMNHFMLPRKLREHPAADIDILLGGDVAMQALLHGMLARGAQRSRLEAKAFGGGTVVATLAHTSIGRRNVEFARESLARENVPLVASDVLGQWSRKLVFDPTSGKAFCRRGEEIPARLAQAELRYAGGLVTPRHGSVD